LSTKARQTPAKANKFKELHQIMSDQKIVKESLLEIFRKNGYNDFARMTQRDFEHIGNEIEKRSGILISGTTIKRLSNGEFSRLPQIATLNAISNYFNFRTWQEYKSSLKQDEKVEKTETTVSVKKTKLPAQLKWGLMALPIAIFGYYIYPNKGQNENFGKASFSAYKNTSNEIPNTVVFNYNIDNIKADSFFIQQSWDKNRRVRIYKNSYTVTDIYYEPGYHIAKLIADDSIINGVEVSIPTDKWFFCANENKAKYLTEYIKPEKFIESGRLAITTDEIVKNKIDPDSDKMYVYSYFPTKLEVPGDNFTLKTRVRMKEVRNTLCPYIGIEVFCQRYFMAIKSTPKGCASEAFLQFGEKRIIGKGADLAAVTFDVKQWTDVELTVENKHVTIAINGKEAFSTTYENTLKLITGLGFLSNGLCEIDKVELKGLDGKVVYENEFGE
jgi:hypothetical protein